MPNSNCPRCGGNLLRMVVIEEGTLIQEISCLACGFAPPLPGALPPEPIRRVRKDSIR